ncbi:hypothetical protein AAMO2058_000926400 [Amorphochlora amoebiformis]|eukprot:1377184-Amorphochlora_amoeboformis.AAC.2
MMNQRKPEDEQKYPSQYKFQVNVSNKIIHGSPRAIEYWRRVAVEVDLRYLVYIVERVCEIRVSLTSVERINTHVKVNIPSNRASCKSKRPEYPDTQLPLFLIQ